MHEQCLNSMLKEYRGGHVERRELEGRIFMYIREHPRRFQQGRWNEDSWDDFVGWLYPRISRAVDHYREQGSSFDNYIIALVRLSAKEYGMRKKEQHIVERTWWNARAEEDAVCEPEEPDYFAEPLQKVSNPRQTLMLLLKSYYYLSDEHLSRLAPALGLTKEALFRMVDNMRKLRVRREEMINGLKQRIHSQFYRCLAFEKRMLAASPQSAHRVRMQQCLEKARKRLTSMRGRLSLMRIQASNKQVAEVMGIAKGTVDSNLHAVRQRRGIGLN